MAKVFRNGKWETIEEVHTDFPIEEYKPTREEIVAEKQSQIYAHKARLKDSDYKIIKCAEAIALWAKSNNIVLPYDITELQYERQSLRDEINVLEEEIYGKD